MTKEDGRGMQAERESNQEKDGKSRKVGAKWKTKEMRMRSHASRFSHRCRGGDVT